MKSSSSGRDTSLPSTCVEEAAAALARVADSSHRPGTACLLSALCCAAFLVILLKLSPAVLYVPFSSGGDASVFQVLAKNVTAGNWWWNNPQLGAPFGADWRDFPMYLTVDYGIIRLLGLLASDPIFAINVCWLLAVIAASALATYSLIRLGADDAVAVCVGVAYALQPFTWFRHIGHFNLTFYFVPLLAGWAVEATADAVEGNTADLVRPWWRRVPAYVVAAAVAQGISYAYNSFFACFYLMLGAALVVAVRRSIRPAAPMLALAAVIVVSFAVNLSPSLMYSRTAGPNTQLVQKYASEADLYGMKLRHLVLPVADHRLPVVRDIAAAFDHAQFPLENENSRGRLGLLGTVGFLYLLGVCCLRILKPGRGTGMVVPVLAVFTVVTLLWATVGGLGSLFNLLISPAIRAYNRMSVFLSYFSLLAVALLLTRAKRRLREAGYRRVLPNVSLALIMILGVLDQDAKGGLAFHEAKAALFNADRAFARTVESRLGDGASVFQLPHTGFPIDPPPGRMQMYENATPYLHTSHLKWSWGSVTGRHYEWGTRVALLAPDRMVAELTAAGFSAIWVDSAGYPDVSRSPIPGLSNILGPPILADPAGRRYVFDLRGPAGRATPAAAPKQASPDVALVLRAYSDLLSRHPEASAVDAITRALQEGGKRPAQIVQEYLNSAEFASSSGLFTATCYLGLFGREPDYAGWNYWTGLLQVGAVTGTGMIEGFLGSTEYKSRYGAAAREASVAQLYQLMKLDPSPAALAPWRERLRSGKWPWPKLLQAVLEEPAFQAKTRERLAVHLLYFSLLNRPPNSAELERCRAHLSVGGSETILIDEVLNSVEYRLRP